METIYWAILLDTSSKAILLSKFPPIHTKIFAEHCTIVFKPSVEEDEILMEKIGNKYCLKVVGYAEDEFGQVVSVSGGIERFDGSLMHITISCDDNTKPVYSNKLVKRCNSVKGDIILNGSIARYTKIGWVLQ